MHPIQSHILKELTLRETSSFARLKPTGIESNRMSYHLAKLLRARWIRKTTAGYRLTPTGQRYVDKLSLASFEPRFQPKIVTLLVVANGRGEHLLYRRGREPFFGRAAFPYGKIHFGETIAGAAARELKEKTGLSADLTHRGDAYLTIRDHGEIASCMLCHVFSGRNPSGTLTASPAGAPMWAAVPETAAELVPGFMEIYLRLKRAKGRFFAEITA